MGRSDRSSLHARSGASSNECPRSAEISALVRRLRSRDRSRADEARARLAILGAPAVEPLIEALEADDHRVRVRAMGVLALIQDRRGCAPLMAMLLDRDTRTREVAARCLGRFPAPEASCSLERLLATERQLAVRVAAVRSLLEHYRAGLESAVRRPVEILLDAREHPRVRGAALTLLPLLRRTDRRALLLKLRKDGSAEIRRCADELEAGAGSPPPRARRTLENLLDALRADDYEVWNDAVHALASMGAPAARRLLEEMERRAHDPEYCLRAGITLKALGRRHAELFAEALDRMHEPLPLQVLVEVAGAVGEKWLVYRLKGLIDRLAAEEASFPARDGFEPMRRVRAKAHLELARVGSRVAIEDLRKAIADPDRRVDLELIAALGLVGKREEIADLLRAYGREDRFTRERIRAAVRAIMKRERVRRNDTMFRLLGAGERRALEAIFGTRAARGSPNGR